MGVRCEINLHKSADGSFVPGSSVFGVIKYYLNEDVLFSNITIAFKGQGRLNVNEYKSTKSSYEHKNKENYFLFTDVIHDDPNGEKLIPKGSYETQFKFKLPEKLPSTLHFVKYCAENDIKCNIEYFLSIKFKRPGIFEFDKKFKKEIVVISGITPKLSPEPTTFNEEKRLKNIFSNKENVVHIKATASTCIIKPGKNIKIAYEVANNTNVNINAITIKLKEVYTFTSNRHRKFDHVNNIKNSEIKTGSIRPGESQVMSEEIEVPNDVFSIDGSQIAERDYFVSIKAKLPFPHSNAVLKIPLQIGDVTDVIKETVLHFNDAPPTYWEAMAEHSESKDDLDLE